MRVFAVVLLLIFRRKVVEHRLAARPLLRFQRIVTFAVDFWFDLRGLSSCGLCRPLWHAADLVSPLTPVSAVVEKETDGPRFGPPHPKAFEFGIPNDPFAGGRCEIFDAPLGDFFGHGWSPVYREKVNTVSTRNGI